MFWEDRGVQSDYKTLLLEEKQGEMAKGFEHQAKELELHFYRCQGTLPCGCREMSHQ